MKMQRVAVIGAGAMGSGIAQVLSQAGLEVLLKDVSKEFVDRGLSNIKRMYESRVKKEVLTQAEADYLFAMVKGTTSYDGFGSVDLVIEAALEEIEVKLSIFKELDKACAPHTILASNTSALSISQIAANTRHPDRVIGMHFFNPAQTMKLVEVIPGIATSREVCDAAMQLCRDLRKIPVKVQECPGFLVNRLLFPYMNEALYVLQEGLAQPQEIDKAVLQLGFPMGPLALFDMTGIDVCQHVNEFLHQEYGPRFAPSLLLKLMVEKGQLGQKSGAGFYVHGTKPASADTPKQVNPQLNDLVKAACQQQPVAKSESVLDPYRLILPMFNEAIYAVQENVVQPADVDVAMQWGCGMSKGLLALAEDKGLKWCLDKLDAYLQQKGERFRSSWLLHKLVRANVHDFAQLQNVPVAAR